MIIRVGAFVKFFGYLDTTYALALGLIRVFSEVCIPLACLVLVRTIVVLGEAYSLRDHTNRVCVVSTTGIVEGTRAAAFQSEAR